MTATDLIGPASPMGLPASYEFLVFFKVLGFVLHLIPMGLWFAGILIALLLRTRADEHAGAMSDRLMNQMPVLIAFGINFGIVPLLFIQVVYHQAFYPATILMAWPWFSVIVLLTVAYYGVYLYAVGLKRNTLTSFKRTAGWVSALLFVAIGFLFSNALSLMANVPGWPALWEASRMDGAVTGTVLNTGDAGLVPRWLMVFGMGVMTTAAWVFIDAAWFGHRGTDAFRRWRGGFALVLYTAGAAIFGAAGSWYVFGTWSTEVSDLMFADFAWLTYATALSPAVAWSVLLALRLRPAGVAGGAVALFHLLVLALNAVSRQVVQNAKLTPYVDATAMPVNTQWSSLLMFLGTFVVGLGVIYWMVRKALEAGKAGAGAEGQESVGA